MNELYKINGVVIKGEQRGKVLGYPTANVRLHKNIPEGIYAGKVSINGKLYFAASFVGSAKTFQKTDIKLESYIFDYSGNLYGKWITVRLYKKMRENKKFDTADALVEQMKADVEEIKKYFSHEVI
jgi:riboflavin kinase/FMN adenylyltransferase